ncbi:hypothetical protein GII30_08900 [Gordonia amarae]|uniref:Uncharacterized protein n=2 Tax=Gordonia amarae TaxID=36821 RepID=G7GVI7_9ACTN|nr:hypothetical protein [Gordonia amarae]MCS3878498.1 hypothetical protein [Gordonia amarae]QHN17109.1 hypothetical protein GII35_09125 [Gordonia amarae]QHN21635.1 hypothetical protein GII34_08905 [Gordonia amarae]QHN30487.1 hypothetical protein GII32_08915 [Gordonia amarae]QHN39263.1 hypothetical protein GII30_08900 [Gordonia amarae]
MTQMAFPQTVTWHLIQYTADMRRREPRNVGVAATDGAGWVVRMLGVGRSGVIDAKALRRLNLAKSDYEPWVRYYADTLGEGGIERVMASQRRRPGEFRVIPGGDDELSGSLDECAGQLFAELVEDGLRAV